jgi:hypothetical protein
LKISRSQVPALGGASSSSSSSSSETKQHRSNRQQTACLQVTSSCGGLSSVACSFVPAG